MIKKNISLLIIIVIAITATSQSIAGEVFRYKFINDFTRFNLMIESNLQFPQLEGLAQLLNIDSLKNEFDMDIDMQVKTRQGEGSAIEKIKFTRINSKLIVGDSVFTDDLAGWGNVNTGSEFMILISSQGEIKLLNKVNIKAGNQVVDMIQRFMPVFPDKSIKEEYTWSDTIGFDLELPEQEVKQIETVVEYTYLNNDKTKNVQRFEYMLYNAPDDSSSIILSGSGYLIFSNEKGVILENNGNITIDTEINLSMFGLPEMLGATPVHIDSEIKLGLATDE